jgi:hypothetical protein
LVLAFRGGSTPFILQIKVDVMCGSDSETSWKLGHPSSNGFVKP